MPLYAVNIASTNFDDKNVRQNELLYFAHGFISGPITIYNRYCCHYTKHELRTTYCHTNNVENERIMNLKKPILNIVTVIS